MTFNPADHTATEVHEYLAGVTDPAEYDAVVAAEHEREGGPRKTALDGLERPLEARGGQPLPAGAVAVQDPPDGRWERLLDEKGRPVTVGSDQVRMA